MAFAFSFVGQCLSEEAGTGHHLPGSGVSLTGMLPAEAGLTVKGSNWLYWGDAGGSRQLGALISDESVENSISSFIGAAVGRGELPPAAQTLAGQVSDAVNARLDRINLSLDIEATQNISTISLIYATPWKIFGGRYYAALPGLEWVEIELSAEEKDAGSVVGKGSKAAGVGFDGLDFGVEPLGDSIGDRVAQIANDVLEMSFDHAGNFDDGLEA